MTPIDNEGSKPESSQKTGSHELADYTVGYGKPPMERRFKSDQTGNRRGRPPGSKNRKTIVREVANEMHTVTEGNRRRRRSTLELMLLTLRNLAAGGNVRAFRHYNKYLNKFKPQVPRSNVGVLVVPAPVSVEEWIREQEEENKTKLPPEGLDLSNRP